MSSASSMARNEQIRGRNTQHPRQFGLSVRCRLLQKAHVPEALLEAGDALLILLTGLAPINRAALAKEPVSIVRYKGDKPAGLLQDCRHSGHSFMKELKISPLYSATHDRIRIHLIGLRRT